MAKSKKNQNKPKLNLTVRDEQRNKLEQMASLENRFIHFVYRPARAQDCARIVFDCRMAGDPATINKESTNENNTDVGRGVDARRLRINGKPCS
jgi:hypothetical protein